MTEQSKLEWTEYKSRFRATTAYGTYWVELCEIGTGYHLICNTTPCCVVFSSVQDAQGYAQMIHERPSDHKHWFNLSDVEQAPYQAAPDLTELLQTYTTLLAGGNLPERIAVQTLDLQALLSAAKPVEIASWAQDLLTAWDQWYSCGHRNDAAKALSDKLILAACFAGIAYDAAMSVPILEDKAPEFLLRIFLIALIDQNSPELDPYRAKNSLQAATQVTDGTKPVDVAAVREAAEQLIRNRFDTYTAKNGKRISIEGDDGEKCWIISFEDMNDLENALRALSAETAQGDTAAVRDVLAERRRQIEDKGFEASHDDIHSRGQIATAAGCYILHDTHLADELEIIWPWDFSWWKPSSRRRDLVKAGALIIAEIERIDRASQISETGR